MKSDRVLIESFYSSPIARRLTPEHPYITAGCAETTGEELLLHYEEAGARFGADPIRKILLEGALLQIQEQNGFGVETGYTQVLCESEPAARRLRPDLCVSYRGEP